MANTYSKYVFFAKYSVDAFRYAFANIFEYVFFYNTRKPMNQQRVIGALSDFHLSVMYI